MGFEKEIRELISSPRYKFKDWDEEARKVIPDVACGVYLIWRGGDFYYVGMSGKDLTAEEVKKFRKEIDEVQRGKKKYSPPALGKYCKGLVKRLNAHKNGSLSGDQFCVYIANRCIAPGLTRGQKRSLESGSLTFDTEVKKFVSDELDYQFYETDNGKKAENIEKIFKEGDTELGKPYLQS